MKTKNHTPNNNKRKGKTFYRSVLFPLIPILLLWILSALCGTTPLDKLITLPIFSWLIPTLSYAGLVIFVLCAANTLIKLIFGCKGGFEDWAICGMILSTVIAVPLIYVLNFVLPLNFFTIMSILSTICIYAVINGYFWKEGWCPYE